MCHPAGVEIVKVGRMCHPPGVEIVKVGRMCHRPGVEIVKVGMCYPGGIAFKSTMRGVYSAFRTIRAWLGGRHTSGKKVAPVCREAHIDENYYNVILEIEVDCF